RQRLDLKNSLDRECFFASFNPYLPVDIRLADRNVITFDAADATGADITRSRYILQQVFLGRHLDEIRQREDDAVARPNVIQSSGNGGWGWCGRIVFARGVVKGQGLAVIDELQILFA